MAESKEIWDTHHHIFTPSVFPYHENRHLTPPAATIAQYVAFKESLGITNSVLTHGMSYGDDCTSLKAFVPQLGIENTRAIGIIDPHETSDDELRDMHAAGVRGVRMNLYRYGAMEDVTLQKIALQEHNERLARLSLPWSLTMTTFRTDFWDELAPFVEESGMSLVTDHFALLKAPSMLSKEYKERPTEQPGFQAIIGLVRSGRLWVKLSAPYRVSEMAPGYEDLKFLVRAFVDANKHRVLWGSDWPHTPRMKIRSKDEALRETPFLEVDDKAWLESLRGWLSDEEWALMMGRNPRALFMTE